MKKRNKIAALDNEYTKEQYAEFQKQQKQLIFKRRRLTVIFLIAIVIFSISGFELIKDYQELNAFKGQKEEVVAESAELDAKLGRLQQDVDLLKDDKYVAKLARSRYLLAKDGERVYSTPDFGVKEPVPTTTEESQTQSQPAEEQKAD